MRFTQGRHQIGRCLWWSSTAPATRATRALFHKRSVVSLKSVEEVDGLTTLSGGARLVVAVLLLFSLVVSSLVHRVRPRRDRCGGGLPALCWLRCLLCIHRSSRMVQVMGTLFSWWHPVQVVAAAPPVVAPEPLSRIDGLVLPAWIEFGTVQFSGHFGLLQDDVLLRR